MQLIKQFGLLLAFWLTGEALSFGLSTLIKIPGAIIGMVLLATALSLGLVKEDQIKDIGDLLLNNIAFFFVPASIGLMALNGVSGLDLFKIISIALISTVTTMVVTMFVTHLLTTKKRGLK